MASKHFEEDEPRKYVKRVMWMKYLQAFVPKTQLAKRCGKSDGYRSIIFDTFAGTGIYGDSWGKDISNYGSPLIALRVCIDFFIKKNGLTNEFQLEQQWRESESSDGVQNWLIYLVFIEKDSKNFEQLVKNVMRLFGCYGLTCKKQKINEKKVLFTSTNEKIPIECRVVNRAFEDCKAPVLNDDCRMATFIDPFGYSDIPFDQVKRFAGRNKEVFINLMTSYINRFFETQEKTANVFGVEHDRLVQLKEEGGDFIHKLVDLYEGNLQEAMGTDFPLLAFENSRIYHLLFLSCHIEGVKAMKECMNRGTQSKDKFMLSEYNVIRQGITLDLGNGQSDEDVAKYVFAKFNGQTVTLDEVERFIWLETPYIFRIGPLSKLVKDENISLVINQDGNAPRRKGTFPNRENNTWFITFRNQD